MTRTRLVEVAPDRFATWLATFERNNAGDDPAQRIVRTDRFDRDPLVCLLIRRGGYAVAVAEGTTLTAHKVGSRYVQSRTAAGGWSQQRFARRRGNQADELVRAVRGHLVRIVAVAPSPPRALLVGGDRALAASVLEDPRLVALAGLPRRESWNLPDPTATVLQDALARGRKVRVTLEERTPT